jgi:hypothetical protein
VPQAKLACGRVGDDVDGMATRSDRPALRLLSGPAACMTASWYICMARGVVPPRITVKVLAPQACTACHGPRTSRSWGEVVRGGDLSCEVETCRARIPLVGNWSETLPTGRKRDVLPVWVLTRVLSLPRLESWP